MVRVLNSFPAKQHPASPGGIAEIQTAMMQSKLKAAEPQSIFLDVRSTGQTKMESTHQNMPIDIDSCVFFLWFLFLWMFYVTFLLNHEPGVGRFGHPDPGLRMKPTMVEGPNSPLYISLPRSSIMPQVHGVPVDACGMCSCWFGAVKYDVPMCWLVTIVSIVEMIELKLRLNLV